MAFQKPETEPLPNFDKRFRAPEPSLNWTSTQREAIARLEQSVPGLVVQSDPVTGAPRLVTSRNGFLTGQNAAGISADTLEQFAENDPYRIPKAFLQEHRALFGHGAEMLDAAKIQREFVTAHSGLKTFVWRQELNGVPVFQAIMTAHVTRDGELVSVGSSFLPDVEYAAQNGVPHWAEVLANPPVSAVQALSAAAAHLGSYVSDSDRLNATRVQDPEGAAQKQRFVSAHLRGEAVAQLNWVALNRSHLKPCWKIELTLRGRSELYRVLVDAQTGEVLLRHCLTQYLTDATFRVFTSDSPSPFSPGHSVPSSTQPALVERVLVTLSALSTNASPAGWIADGGNETLGNNVDAHTDRNDDDLPDLPRPRGSPERVFDFPLALTNAPSTYGNASVVQLFYWNNWMHDRLYELGFTEEAGNFQANNFGRGGLGNDAVQADGQDGGGFNNANFSTPEDGSPGRMQMYLFNGPNPDRDGDLDAEIILHEYTHGLSNRRVGGGVGIFELQSAGMGEGWSDFYPLALLSEPGDDLNGNYAAGGYLTYRLADLTENYYFGIRRYPYSTDLTTNPLTFKDIDPGQASDHPGIPISPLFGGGIPADEVHNQGEVWCVTLWDARANLVRKWGFERGNQLILQLVTDGMNLSPANPNFLEARDAIIQADRVLTGGLNRDELWAAFAKRGMGFSASSPPSSTTIGVEESFDLPDDLLVLPNKGFASHGPEGGPFTVLTHTFTLSNTGTNAVQWSIINPAGWLRVSPESGAIPVGNNSTDVTVGIEPIAQSLPAGLYTESLTFTNHVTGRFQTRRVFLRVGQPDFLTEEFDDAPMKLPHRQLTFTPDEAGSYLACIETAMQFPVDPTDGDLLLLEDDDFAPLTLADGAEVKFFGTNYSTIYVSANGYITFTRGVSDFDPSLQAHFQLPRLSAFFTDLDPTVGGLISWKQLTDRVVVTYEDVPEFFFDTSNNFQIEMFFSGVIRVTYLEFEATTGLVGLSNGGGIPLGFSESDFASAGACLPALKLKLPASAVEDAGRLLGSVALPQESSVDTRLRFESSDPALLEVQPEIVIPAGELIGTFSFEIKPNPRPTGTRLGRVTARADGFRPAHGRMRIEDNESATLQIQVPDRAREGDNPMRGAGMVTITPVLVDTVLIELASANTNEVLVPPILILPAGQTHAIFDLSAVDDRRIDGTIATRITAHVDRWEESSASISVEDNETRDLRVQLKRRIGENGGTLANAGMIEIAGTLPSDLAVSLESSDPTEFNVPASVLIRAGETTAVFEGEARNDSEIDGTQTVHITAQASDFTSATAQILVLDDETPPAPAGPHPAHLSTNNPPRIELTWIGEGEAAKNGGFETGDFNGWIRQNSGSGSFVLTQGDLDPEGPELPTPAFSGRYCAVSRQIGPGKQMLAQEITIPEGVTSAVLRWADRIRNHASLFLPEFQEFRVEVQSSAGDPLAVLFTTQPDDPLLGDWTSRSADLLDFSGQTIRIAFIEQDNLGYFNVYLDDIRVEIGSIGPPGAPGATEFEVFFGKAPVPGASELLGTTSEKRWPLAILPIDSTYYWQVIARKGEARTAGPIWQFSVPGVGPIDHFSFAAVASPQFVTQPFSVEVQARDIFENVATNFSGRARLIGGIEIPPVIVGSESNSWEYPMGTANHDQRVQAIYLREELGPARRLTALALFVVTPPGQTLNRWTIRMKHSQLKRFELFSPLWERTGWTTVYQNNETISGSGWVEFQFSTPFDYNGGSSLMIDFSFNNSTGSTDGSCRFFAAESRGMAFSADSDFGDPLTWSGSEPLVFFAESRIPAIRLSSFTGLQLQPSTTGDFKEGLWSGDITIEQVANGMILRVEDEDGHVGRSAPFDVQARDDLSITMRDTPDPVTVTEPVTLEILVNNSGPSEANDVVVTNKLGSNVTFNSIDLSQGTGVASSGQVVASLGTLAGGASARITLVVTPTSTSPMTNIATIGRAEFDPVDSNNTAITVTTVNARPAISIADSFVDEGHAETRPMEFELTLTLPSNREVSVSFTAQPVSATQGIDFVATNGVVTFPPGVVSQRIQVLVIGDTVDEADEILRVQLSNPQHSTIRDGIGTGTIFDDDGPQISISDALVVEGHSGNTNAVFRLELSAASPQTITVEYETVDGSALAPGDFTARTGSVTFGLGSTNRTITVPVRGDIQVEADETFSLNLFGAIGGNLTRTRAEGRIVNDDGLPGQLHHFAWSPLPSIAEVNTPLKVMLAAQDIDNLPVKDFSGTATLSARYENPDVEIGRAVTAWEFPMGTSFEDSRIQSIYLAEEVGPARWLTGLALYVVKAPSQTLTRWTIRMKHTPLTQYTANSTWDRTGWTLVYQKPEVIAGTGWIAFEFTTPFLFNGTDQLMIDLSFNNSTFTDDGLCRYSRVAESRSIFARADSDFGDPLNWSATFTPFIEIGRELPNVLLMSRPSVPVSPTVTENFVEGVWNGEITFLATGSNVFLNARHPFGYFGTSAAVTVQLVLDTDGDGLPDQWEEQHRLNPRDASDASADTDGDGASNGWEFLAGTDPQSAADVFKIISLRRDSGQMKVLLGTVPGKKYLLERRTALTGGSWEAVGLETSATGTELELSISEASPDSLVFYRARLVP
ncbi:MAG: M36 family metallopeptidase [Verrucomicrobiota bacterium]